MSYRVLCLCKMNPLDVTALDLLVAHDSCWEGVILCPNSDGCGEYNLLSAMPKGSTVSENKVCGEGRRVISTFTFTAAHIWD